MVRRDSQNHTGEYRRAGIKCGYQNNIRPVMDKAGDLAGILQICRKRCLFIDEIHRLNNIVEEYLYSAMEDYTLDIMIDRGANARSIQISLPRFTLVGATTRAGLLTADAGTVWRCAAAGLL